MGKRGQKLRTTTAVRDCFLDFVLATKGVLHGLGGGSGGGSGGVVVDEEEVSGGATAVSEVEGVGSLSSGGRKAKDDGKQQSRTNSNFWFEYRPRDDHA